jgi:hypothetical protein
MALKSLSDRLYAEFPEHDKIRGWFASAIISDDFSFIIAAIDSKVLSLENEYPTRFSEKKLSFVEMLDENKERRARLEIKGLPACLKDNRQAGFDYLRLTELKTEVEFFRNAFAIIKENFGNEDQLNAILLKAVRGDGVEDLREALKGKIDGAFSLLPRRDDGSLPLQEYFRAVEEWKGLMDVAKGLLNLKVEGRGGR